MKSPQLADSAKRIHGRLRDFYHDLKLEQVEHPQVDHEDPQTHQTVRQTIGCAFVDCGSPQAAREFIFQADAAVLHRDNKASSKTWVLRLVSFIQFEKYLKGEGKPIPLEVPPPLPGPPQRFDWFTIDERLFDQIVYTVNRLCYAAWFNYTTAKLEAIPLPNHLQASDDFKLTPDGIWLGSRIGNVLNFYGGERWTHFSSFAFEGLSTADPDERWFFSPDGRFMICKTKLNSADNQQNPSGAAIYDLAWGTLIQKVPLDPNDYANIAFTKNNDVLKLVNTDLFILRKLKDGFSEPKLIAGDVIGFIPSPEQPIVVTFRKGSERNPPRVVFFQLEGGQQIRGAQAPTVILPVVYWHPRESVCALVTRAKGKDRSFDDTLTIYDLRSGSSTYNQTFKGQEIMWCAWDLETDDLRIAIIVAPPGDARQIQYFDLGKNLTRIATHLTLGSRLQFSPSGRFAVADDIRSNYTMIQFFDMREGLLRAVDVSGVESLEWDPSGVFILASQRRVGFSIFLLDGNLVVRESRADFKKCMWRPRQCKVTKDDFDRIEPEVAEAVAKFGRFGVVDPSVREQEQREMKIEKMQRWLQGRRQAPVGAQGPRGEPQQYEFVLQLTRPVDDIDTL